MGAETLIQGAAGTLLGIGLNQQGQQQQMENQQKLNQQQYEHQQQLNKQMQGIQQQNWDYTNYENQIKHIEKAGLNVGMLYGQGGAGGSIMGGASGGSAQGGNAPQNNAPQAMGVGLQAGMMQSTIDLQQAQAEKLRVEAEKLKTVDTGNVLANTALTNMNTENAKVLNQLNTRGLEATLDTITANRDKAVAESSSAITSANVSATTKQSQIDEINARALNEALKASVMKSGMDVNDAQIQKMVEDVKIGKFNAQTNADFQGLDKVAGGQLTKLINYFNIKPDNQRKIE